MTKSKANKIIELIPKNKLPENSENKTNNPSDKNPKLNIEDLLTRIGIYSLNIGSKYLSQALEAKETIGNFYTGIFFAGLDVIARKNSKYKRVIKAGGFLFYVGSCGYDLISGSNDFDNIWPHLGNFALDATMAYQLGKDMGSLYNEESETELDKPHSLRADLKFLWPFGKSKDKNNDKNLENKVSKENVSEKKEDSKSKFKEYLSAFGKGISSGASFGYGFGKSAFEKLSENYSNYKTEQKESNELKKVKDEEIKQERAEQKIKNAGFEDTPFKKKKEILFYLDEKGKNPNFMKNYEIENAYGDFRQKPIKEQIQIVKDKRDYFETNLKQMKSASWTKRFNNSFEISDTKSALKKLDKILFELEVEEKNYPYQSQNIKNFIKKKEDEDNKNKFEI